jgi:WD40 repeat protein
MSVVFLSYAREDQPFGKRLHDALSSSGRPPAWDQDHETVRFSAPWRAEIRSAIEGSDKFIFVISPDSLASQPCADELSHAVELNKQVIPVLRRRPAPGQQVPAAVEEINWIFFDDDAAFDVSFAQLTLALDTDLGYATAHTRLLVRSSEWTESKRDRSRLLRGSDLRAAEEWLAEAGSHLRTTPTQTQREYIAASRRAADRAARLWRGALASGLAVAIVLAAVAFIQRNQARHEATVAQARALAAEATADLSVNPAASLQLALKSTQVNPSAAGVEALRLALAADRQRMAFQPGFGTGTQAAWSPAAEIIAATGSGNSVQLWNPRTGRLFRVLGSLPARDPITQLAFNPQGTLLAAIARDGLVGMWDPQTGTPVDLAGLNADIQAAVLSRYPGLTGTWDPQAGNLYLYGPGIRGIVVEQPAAGQVRLLNTTGPVSEIAFAPSGSRAVVFLSTTGFQEEALIVNFATLTSMALQKPADLFAWSEDHLACWMPGSTVIATWNPVEAQDETLRVFSAQTGAELFEHSGATFSAAACGATAVGPYVAAGDYAGEGTLVQARTNGTGSSARQQFNAAGLFGHTEQINSVATSNDGNYIATGSDDGTVRVWDAVTGRQLSLIAGAGTPIELVGFSADGGAVLAVGENGLVQVADTGVGEPDVPLAEPAHGSTYALGFADGSSLVYGINETTRQNTGGQAPAVTGITALLWRDSTGALVASYPLPGPPRLASPACTPALQSHTFCEMAAPAQEFTGVTVSADGSHLAYATADAVVVGGFGSGSIERLPLPDPATGLTFAAPGDRDVVVLTNTAVDIWRPISGGTLTRIPQPSAPIDAELSADGSTLATANVGGTVTVWDAATGSMRARFSPQPVHTVFAGAPVPVRVALSPDGNFLAVGTDFGSVDLWQVAARRLISSRLLTNPVTQDTYPIAELSFADGGSEILAANYPQIGSGDSEPPGTAVVLAAATGRQLTDLSSPAQNEPALNPGVALSPNGSYVLGGVEGFAPLTSLAGADAVYAVAGSQQLADLENSVALAPPILVTAPNITAVTAWAPDGVQVLTGAPAVYACDACGSLAQLQSIAATRLAWAVPLTPGHDDPPSGNAFS